MKGKKLHELPKKLGHKENLIKYSKRGGEATKEKAKRQWAELLEHAFNKAKKNPKKYSARLLSLEITSKVEAGLGIRFNSETFRKKIRKSRHIVIYLKN